MHRRLTFAALAAAVLTLLWCGSSAAVRAGEAAFVGMQLQGSTPDIAKALGLAKPGGVLVRDVALGGPSAAAGFQRGDLILRFAGKDVDTFETLLGLVKGLNAGDKVPVAVLRHGATVDLTLETGTWPESWRVTQSAFGAIPEVGLTLASLTEKVRDSFSVRWGSTGVVVTLVNAEKAQNMDLQRGELIRQVNQEDVWLPDQLIDKFQEAKKNGHASLLLLVEGVAGFRFSLLPVR